MSLRVKSVLYLLRLFLAFSSRLFLLASSFSPLLSARCFCASFLCLSRFRALLSEPLYTCAQCSTSVVYRARLSKGVFVLVAMRFLRLVALLAMAWTSCAWLVARNSADLRVVVLCLVQIHPASMDLVARRCLAEFCDIKFITHPRSRPSHTDAVLPSSCSFESISRPSSSASPVRLDQD